MERTRMAEIALLLDEVDVKSGRYNYHNDAANSTVLRQVEQRKGLRQSTNELVSWMKRQGVDISADEIIEYCEELSKKN